MPTKVYVTQTQSDAAKLIVERNAARGRSTPIAVQIVANARAEATATAEVIKSK